jgi:hypothetical protein
MPRFVTIDFVIDRALMLVSANEEFRRYHFPLPEDAYATEEGIESEGRQS